ncbi:hypothetical protein [Verrucomicrobium spinosum]|uniref:hypothetical protein n=1 Tax=Verrucomicrobium spinosum TaxID=2736 RepID=UPI003CCD6F04
MDCGTVSVAETDWLQQEGVDCIIVDHHEPAHRLPTCVALVNPKLEAHTGLTYFCTVGWSSSSPTPCSRPVGWTPSTSRSIWISSPWAPWRTWCRSRMKTAPLFARAWKSLPPPGASACAP